MFSYPAVIGMTLANLAFAMTPGNPIGWINALVFFGCAATLGCKIGYDITGLVMGGKE